MEGPVTCLDVRGGNRALLVFQDEGPFAFGHIGVDVTDDPVSGDEFFFSNPGVPPTGCEAATTFRTFGGPTSGFVVHEAPPLPTSKDQCKDGGWRNFPGFKNQGQCVSFVATGGKKQR